MAIGIGRPIGGRELKIRLELGELDEQDDGTYNLPANATVTDKGEPVPDVEVQFYKQYARDGDSVLTEGDGRAHKVFTGLTKGDYTFEALIVGTTTKHTQTKKIRESRMKTADNWTVDIIPDGEKRYLFVRIFTKDNVGIGGIRVYISPRLFTDVQLTTNTRGVIGPLEIPQKEQTTTYTVVAPETPLRQKTFTVEGRPRYIRPAPLPRKEEIAEALRGELTWNPLRNIKVSLREAWRRFKARKAQRSPSP